MQKNGSQPSVNPPGNQEINLRYYFSVLRKRQTTVLTFFIITVLVVIVATFSITPLYTASSQVLIEENLGDNTIERGYSYRRYDPQFLDTQFKIITSFNVVKRVIQRLHLNDKYRNYFLKKEKNQFLFLKSFKEKIITLFDNMTSRDNLLPGEGFEDSDLLVGPETISDLEVIVEKINDDLEIKPERATRIVNITYSHRHPGMAKLVTNSLISAYKEELQEIKHSSSSDTLKWMTEKAEEERKKLEDSELALQAYMRKNDIITIENKLAIYPQKLTEFSSQLSIVQAERKKLESVYFQIKAAKKRGEDIETIPVIADNAVLKLIREKIYQAEQDIKQLSKTYGYKNPVMIKAKDELKSLGREKTIEIKRIVESTKNAYDLIVTQEKNVTELLNKTKNEVLNLNEKFVQYSIMQREVNTNSVLYDTLTASLKKASVTVQSQRVNVWVVKEASLPRYPSEPKKLINLMLAIAFGLLGGVGLAFFIEYIDNTVHSPEEIENRFGHTVLGTVEELKGKGQEVESFVRQNPLSPFAESFRLIRSNIMFSSVDHPPRQILLTSMAPSEGKSVTTVNIARVLAQANKKVIIVDCDMRKPRQHTLFGRPNSIGLSNYLTGNTKENIIQLMREENIALVTAGPTPPNPAELINSHKMKKLLAALAKVYDFILLDSPPVLSVTDSLTLSTLAEGTVVVVRAGETTYDMLTSGIRKLNAVNAHLLGFVLNCVTKTSGGEGYYHGYHEYYSKNE